MRTRLVLLAVVQTVALALPARASAQDVVIVVPAAEPPATPAVVEPPVAPPTPAAAVEPEPAPPEPSSVYVHEAEELALEDAPPRFAPGFFSLGLSALVGTRDDARDELAPTWTGGLDVGFRVLPFLSLGVRRVTFAHASTLGGDRFAVSAAPMVELALPIMPRLQPFVQVGSAVQVRFGGEQGRATGVAPFVGLGMRFFVAEIFSVAVESVAHVPVTDGGFLFGHEVLPQSAIVLQGGVALAFHIQ